MLWWSSVRAGRARGIGHARFAPPATRSPGAGAPGRRPTGTPDAPSSSTPDSPRAGRASVPVDARRQTAPSDSEYLLSRVVFFRHDQALPPRQTMEGSRAQDKATQQLVDDEVRRMSDAAHRTVAELLTAHRPQLDALTEALLRSETLDGIDAYRVAGLPLSPADPTEGTAAKAM